MKNTLAAILLIMLFPAGSYAGETKMQEPEEYLPSHHFYAACPDYERAVNYLHKDAIKETKRKKYRTYMTWMKNNEIYF